MITFGMVIGSLIKGNPRIVIMATKKVVVGTAVEVEGIKIAQIDNEPVIVLTI